MAGRGRPPSVFVPRLSPSQARRLQEIMRRGASDYVTVRRAQIVLLSAQRESPARIARAVRSTPEHVRAVIHAFNDAGLGTLKPRWYLEGRPRTFGEETRARIVEIACARPKDVGAPFTEWSLSKLQAFLMEEGVVEEISLESIRRILAEEEISYQRLKTWKQSPDPDYEAKKNRVLRTRRMARHRVPVVALDEFGPLSLRPWPGQGWFRQKHPRRRRATYKRDKGVRYFMGGLDLTRDQLFGEIVVSKNQFAFIDLLRAARKRYPRSKRLFAICGTSRVTRPRRFSPTARQTGSLWCSPQPMPRGSTPSSVTSVPCASSRSTDPTTSLTRNSPMPSPTTSPGGTLIATSPQRSAHANAHGITWPRLREGALVTDYCLLAASRGPQAHTAGAPSASSGEYARG